MIQRGSIPLHGHDVSYRMAGEGPLVVLLHGITSSSHTWEPLMEDLADRYTLVAPDLLGHGESAKPKGDYSLGAYASGVRDLLAALGFDRGTVVGHSLGGGIAMQFAYQFPERLERLALVSSGGLGGEVNPLLRAATLPGAELVVPVLGSSQVMKAGGALASVLGRLGLRAGNDLEEIAHGFASLRDPEARRAFLHTVRSVIDLGGQRVQATDRLYLAAEVPTLIVWGDGDPIIPAAHGRAAHEGMPGSRLEIFEGAGHFPHLDDQRRFARLLADWLDTTEPAELEEPKLRRMLREGAAPPRPLRRSRTSVPA